MNASGKDRLLMESDVKLKSNTAIVETLIENASEVFNFQLFRFIFYFFANL